MPPAHLPSPCPTSSFWQSPPSKILVGHHTTPSLPHTASVVIIGSGITGSFAAHRLAEGGQQHVVLLEAREACSAATGRNGGHCQPVVYGKPTHIAEFEMRNFHAMSSLIQREDIPCEWQKVKGACHAFYSRETFAVAKAEVLALKKDSPQLAGLVEIIEENSRLKELHVPTARGAIVQTEAAKMAPYKLVAWILEDLIKRSHLNLQTSTPVLSISPRGKKWVVSTQRGEILTSHVLLATNAYTSHLVPRFESLIVPVQGEMSALTPPPFLQDQALDHSYAFLGNLANNSVQDDYLIQRPSMLGGQLMFGGGRALASRQGVNEDSDDSIDPEAARYLRAELLSCLQAQHGRGDDLEGNNQEELIAEAEWTGIMGFSRDNLPWVGGVPDMEGVWLCGGYTGHGMVNAPLSATHIANLIFAAGHGRDWRELEKRAVSEKRIPHEYVISSARIKDSLVLPEVEHGTSCGHPGRAVLLE